MHIKCFNNRVRYMASKAKPKKVSLRTLETGENMYFLCKQASLFFFCETAAAAELSASLSMLREHLVHRVFGADAPLNRDCLASSTHSNSRRAKNGKPKFFFFFFP